MRQRNFTLAFCVTLFASFLTGEKQATAQDQQGTLIFHPKHQFADFPASESFPSSGIIKANLKSNVDGQTHKDEFSTIDISTAERFGGHYVIIGWGCGSSCQEFDVLDVKSGTIYKGMETSAGWKVVPNSNMLIANPPDSDGSYMTGLATGGEPELYLWKNNKFVLLQSTHFSESDYSAVAKKIIAAIKKGDRQTLTRYMPERIKSCEENPMFSIPGTREELLTDLKSEKGDHFNYTASDHTIDVTKSEGHEDYYLTLTYDGEKLSVSCVNHMEVE